MTPRLTLLAVLIVIICVEIVALVIQGQGRRQEPSDLPIPVQVNDAVEKNLLDQLANSPAAEDRADAAQRLGRLRLRTAVPQLLTRLNDGNARVRGLAAWALGEIGDKAAIDPLIAAMIQSPANQKNARGFTSWEVKDLPEITAALEKLTGESFGFDVEMWKQWQQSRAHRNARQSPSGDKR